MAYLLIVAIFSRVVSSPGSRQENSRVSSCSCHDQSTGHRYPVKYRSDGYETSVPEGPTLILHLLVEAEKSSSDTTIREGEVNKTIPVVILRDKLYSCHHT